ncbi:tetratricopeptide repeat-containing sulfotransferase family protein [Frateuria hangzhouensis]|uniref:tetratricopeptide repeat-containing sulfotransferase family protein n=1 Tax=Frateuria hangzhouensis TaxID=2995589 RepID=UPI002260CF91|nr:sulfotransferase [Frateuria sp. STR12]MCX7513287.1 sulfotransferase [Frateuria sp. STR12]
MNTPDSSTAECRRRRRARHYIDTQQLAAAQATLESLVQLEPNDASARMELADVMFRRGQLRASTSQLLQVAKMPLDEAGRILELVRALYNSGETLAARTCLDRLATIPGLPADVLSAQAGLRKMFGEVAESKSLMERAIAAGADTPDDHFQHAVLLQYSGELAAAQEALETCLRRWPLFGGAAMALANLRKQTAATHDLDFLHQQLERIPQGTSHPADNLVRAEFESALFKELDDLGRYEEAWSALARSNALMHALNPYDAPSEAALTAALTGASAPDGRGNPGMGPSHKGPTPIFIVGLPRSGTTLLDRMLSSHSRVVSAGEINDFRRQLLSATEIPPTGTQGLLKAIERSRDIDFATLGARYLKQTQWRAQGRSHYIDKLPSNIQMVPFIRRALPHAPILHLVRDPMDVCFSNLKAMFGSISAYSYQIDAMAHYYAQYARQADHWRATLPQPMLDVSYAALVQEPEATLRRVLDYCGLDFETGCLSPEHNAAPVLTPSSVQVRAPIHTRALGQWRNYAEHLTELQAALDRHLAIAGLGK